MRRAFSLVEILIVVALIALLASVVLPTAFGALRRGQMTQTFDALNDALIEASAEASRNGVPYRVSLERPVGDDLWSLWVREDAGESGLELSDESPQEFPAEPDRGRLIAAFPIDVELGSEAGVGSPPESDTSNTLPEDQTNLGEDDVLTLAVVLPGGRVFGGDGLVLDESEGDRRWRVTLDPIASRFASVEVSPSDLAGTGLEPDGAFDQNRPFETERDWFDTDPSESGRP